MSYVEMFEGIANRVRNGANPHEAIRAFALVANISERELIHIMSNRAAADSRRAEAETSQVTAPPDPAPLPTGRERA